MLKLTFLRQIKLPCGLKSPPPASRATAVGDLSLNSQQEGCSTPPPPRNRPSAVALPPTLRAVIVACRRLSSGPEPPAAAARPVSGSRQVDHLRTPGEALWRAAQVSSCPLCSRAFPADPVSNNLSCFTGNLSDLRNEYSSFQMTNRCIFHVICLKAIRSFPALFVHVTSQGDVHIIELRPSLEKVLAELTTSNVSRSPFQLNLPLKLI